MKVWILEDEPITAFAHKMLLQKILQKGCEIKSFANVNSALEALASIEPEDKPELILLDLNFGELESGWDFLQAIHLPDFTRLDTKIIIITSDDIVESRLRGNQYAIVKHVLYKPTNEEELTRAIKSLD